MAYYTGSKLVFHITWLIFMSQLVLRSFSLQSLTFLWISWTGDGVMGPGYWSRSREFGKYDQESPAWEEFGSRGLKWISFPGFVCSWMFDILFKTWLEFVCCGFMGSSNTYFPIALLSISFTFCNFWIFGDYIISFFWGQPKFGYWSFSLVFV